MQKEKEESDQEMADGDAISLNDSIMGMPRLKLLQGPQTRQCLRLP